MKPGRNDPCPCGSGKKYKHCCAARDAKAAPALRLLGRSTTHDLLEKSREALRPDIAWEVEVIPLGGGIESDPTARPVAVLIAGGGLIIHADVVSHPPAEADGLAALVATAVDDVIARGGSVPAAVHVRHAEVAEMLAPRVAHRQIAVAHRPKLPVAEKFGAEMRQAIGGHAEAGPAASLPHTWAAWGLPKEMIAELFAASAEFHAARPWTHLENDEAFRLALPTGGSWTAALLGSGGQEFGLVLYEDVEDFRSLFSAESEATAWANVRSKVISLTFIGRGVLPKPMVREVAAAGWRVDGPNAYPMLWVLNTPGGGITERQMSELIIGLRVVARFTVVYELELADPEGMVRREWTDEVTGAVVSFVSVAQVDTLWPVPTALEPALPTGPNADARAQVDAPDGALGEREQQLMAGFADHLHEVGAPEGRASRDVDNAELFMSFGLQHQGVPLAAMTEFDLRVFLYDWFPRKVLTSRSAAMTIRSSLRRFFTYLAERQGIVYPWAASILRDKASFEERWDSFPGGHWWDSEVQAWQGGLYGDLGERAMISAPLFGESVSPGGTMGLEEHRVHEQLQREWLIWRDELIRDGLTEPNAVRSRLLARQHEWERGPQPWLDGRTAIDVITRERRKREKDASPR